MRFRTKITLAMGAVIGVSTTALVLVSEAKIKAAATRQFSRDFAEQVAQIADSREDRSEEFIHLCETLARHPFVIASLKGQASAELSTEFWRSYLDILRENEPAAAFPGSGLLTRDGPGPGLSGGGEKRLPGLGDMESKVGLVAVMNRDGELQALLPANPGEDRKRMVKRIKFRTADARERLQSLLERDSAAILYLPVDLPDGTSLVQEMIATPVLEPDTGQRLGLFLRSSPAETEAQRFLEKYQQTFSSAAPYLGAIYLEGQLYARDCDPAIRVELAASVSQALDRGAGRDESQPIRATLAAIPYQIYLARLPGSEGLDESYQVAAFPLDHLGRELRELRLQGSGLGLAAMLLGLGLAQFLARRLTLPLQELADGTRAIQAGNLDHRVMVRSNDEIGSLAKAFNGMAEELTLKAQYRELLGKVSDEAVASALVAGTLDLQLGGEIKHVTVLFCDIRGFTDLSELLPPTELIALLNEHMGAMAEIVRSHGGVIDIFIGDEIMAVFGALRAHGDEPAQAAACARAMMLERERRNAGQIYPLPIGIGLATGEVVAGCLGSHERLNYTVIGARVNLASRLCGAARPGEILLDEATAAACGIDEGAGSRMELSLKGFRDDVVAYRWDGPGDRSACLSAESLAPR
jgi:class 3 adenylate cyclase